MAAIFTLLHPKRKSNTYQTLSTSSFRPAVASTTTAVAASSRLRFPAADSHPKSLVRPYIAEHEGELSTFFCCASKLTSENFIHTRETMTASQ
jgi:hypothetical protein